MTMPPKEPNSASDGKLSVYLFVSRRDIASAGPASDQAKTDAYLVTGFGPGDAKQRMVERGKDPDRYICYGEAKRYTSQNGGVVKV